MAHMAADYMNKKFDFPNLILKAMRIVAVSQINMDLSSKGMPSFKVIEDGIKKAVVKIDAGKGYFATGAPKQKMSFKIK